jgi:hypothetical protein
MVRSAVVESGRVREEITVGDRFVARSPGKAKGLGVEVKRIEAGSHGSVYVHFHLEGCRTNRVEVGEIVARMIGGGITLTGVRWVRV